MAEDKTEKRINPFTLEEEDVPEAVIAPSPTDQRILAAPPHTDPLPELVARVVNNTSDDAGVDLETHVGPSLQGDPLPGETPLPYVPQVDETVRELNEFAPEQHKDVPPPNDEIIKATPDVKPEDYGDYVGQAVPENKEFAQELVAHREDDATATPATVENPGEAPVGPVPSDEDEEAPAKPAKKTAAKKATKSKES